MRHRVSGILAFMNHLALFTSLVVFALTGCSTPQQQTDCVETRTLHANGAIASAGKTCAGLRHGEWQEWYSDGALKWKGSYTNADVVYTPLDTAAHCEMTLFRGDSLRVGRSSNVRIRVGNIHPGELMVAVANGKITVRKNKDLYDYDILPGHAGELKLFVFWRNHLTGRQIQRQGGTWTVYE